MTRINNESKSLEDVHSSIDTTPKKGFLRKLFAFAGPAYLVSVGYMDPGNWATDIAGGSHFGYALIWVILMSNLIAMLLQSLCARLGIVAGKDLAQLSRITYSKGINLFLYVLAEIAITATDLAEVLGMAIGIQLLFGIPLLIGVSITVLDTFVLLILQHYGMRKMEALIVGLISVIGFSFLAEMIFAKPLMSELFTGFIPSIPNSYALYIAIGIIGATVMPHNLYLHTALVQTRKYKKTPKGIWEAIKFNTIDSIVALNLAFFVNAAILVLAAAAFYKSGMFHVEEIQDAYRLLEPILGTHLAPILFAVALIAAGQSSTITGTLAGQIVMEGYLNIRIQPWLRRLITRLLAIIPAFLTILIMGEKETGPLLVLSQVVLSLQLGFAVIPLIHFVSSKKLMGEFMINKWIKLFAWSSALIIVVLNIKLVFDEINSWIISAGSNSIWVWLTAVPVAVFSGIILVFITVKPFFKKKIIEKTKIPHGGPKELIDFTYPQYKRIAISVDFSDLDGETIKNALSQGGKDGEYLLIHIVETAGASVFGKEIYDFETGTDEQYIKEYAERLNSRGYKTNWKLGYGTPKKSIPNIVTENESDLLVMGAHGHKLVKDILFGTTVDAVRHKVKVPVLVVRKFEVE